MVDDKWQIALKQHCINDMIFSTNDFSYCGSEIKNKPPDLNSSGNRKQVQNYKVDMLTRSGVFVYRKLKNKSENNEQLTISSELYFRCYVIST